MNDSNKPSTGPGSPRRRSGWTYPLAGVAVVGGIWLGVSSGLGAEDGALTAGTQRPTPSRTSDPGASESQAPAPEPSAEPSPEPASTAPPTGSSPAAGPTADGGAAAEGSEPAAPVEEQDVETAVQLFVGTTAALNAVSADAAAIAELGALADGAALEELKVQGDEMAVNRWSLDGEAEVDAVKVLNEPSTGDLLQVQACIDSSAVALKDENGALIQAKEAPGTRRSLNLYDLELRDGALLVVNHYFPDNADC